MRRGLRYVDPTRSPGPLVRGYAVLAATRPARFVSRHVNWKLDPMLLRLTGGRVASTLVFPTALLETRGAKSGEARRHAVIYFHDGDRAIIVASNAGGARHPSWYHNLLANPDVALAGISMRAHPIMTAADLARLWPLADQVFPAFAKYRELAAAIERTIPIVALTPTRTE